ncbi:Fc.00g039410.m01.CDS01 [Cosmosporella sp. VM-42]
MLHAISLLAFSGFASADLQPQKIVRNVKVRSRMAYLQTRAIRNSPEPCQILGKAYEASNTSADEAVFIDVPPSVGITCLKSVPVDKTRNLELLEYLTPFKSFQSTIETLVDPQKVICYLFVAASNGHFNYPPALLNTMLFARTELDLISISKDEIQLPEVYLKIDGMGSENANELEYELSPVESQYWRPWKGCGCQRSQLPGPRCTVQLSSGSKATSSAPTPTSLAVPGYPDPVVRDVSGAITGYFLNEIGYEDTVVLSILSFLAICSGADTSNDAEFEFIKTGRRIIKKLVDVSKKEKRDRLIIDLSANGGESIKLATEIYGLLFPKSNLITFHRLCANQALGAASAADYKDEPIKTGEDLFGPYTVVGQNVTIAFNDDVTKPIGDDGKFYYNGFDPNEPPAIKDAPF